MYDVVVIGAGPAGSTAAKVLADKGLHILLVEWHKFPRYKGRIDTVHVGGYGHLVCKKMLLI